MKKHRPIAIATLVLSFVALSGAFAADMDNPAPALDTSTTPPATPVPTPVTSIPEKTESSPPADTPPAPAKDLYEEYNEYVDRTREREKAESNLARRDLFPHEDGSWQIGFAYLLNAFENYNFNRVADQADANFRASGAYAKTRGVNLLLTYFPVKSLSFGRLGVGIVGGVYWARFNSPTGIGGTQTADVLQAYSYGGRLVYELDYSIGQVFVPFIVTGYDNILVKSYQPLGVTTHQRWSQHYGGGLRINLNRIEPTVASRALVNTGVRKFYLTYTATERPAPLNSVTHNVGMDFEF